ncbi:Ferrochelatase, mitochondrial [Thelohanellus kitauei]|uniref:Ferrochelatase n=1 Tax=Thelohanellus kitauei TaxID=669202 RepID=A0A0C2MXZ3_THEKT|nr:Ferrochelatase, mitochondrial [Thelohanellus kitauei]
MTIKTGIVMLNMGEPRFPQESRDYLFNILNDKDFANLVFRSILAPLISRIKSKSLEKKYNMIGGESPLRKWTHVQGSKMCEILDVMSPETSPHKYYVGFRYSPPFTHDAISSALQDGVERLIFFSQYPQFSCSTSGSSFNEAADFFIKNPSNIPQISMIDRWYDHPSYIKSYVTNLKMGLEQVDASVRDKIPIIFSPHSVPMSVVIRGDSYTLEATSTIHDIIKENGTRNPTHLAWQSKSGCGQWMEPDTNVVVDSLIEKGRGVNGILLAPVSFTCDNVETSYDIDIAMKKRLEQKLYRVPSFNDQDHFAQVFMRLIEALADIVVDHIKGNLPNERYRQQCHQCMNPRCTESRRIFLT